MIYRYPVNLNRLIQEYKYLTMNVCMYIVYDNKYFKNSYLPVFFFRSFYRCSHFKRGELQDLLYLVYQCYSYLARVFTSLKSFIKHF